MVKLLADQRLAEESTGSVQEVWSSESPALRLRQPQPRRQAHARGKRCVLAHVPWIAVVQ